MNTLATAIGENAERLRKFMSHFYNKKDCLLDAEGGATRGFLIINNTQCCFGKFI